MDDNGRRVLEMLSEGKITVDEAERLLALVESPEDPAPPPRPRNGPVKYLRIVGEDGDERFNIRVPLSLIRGGVEDGDERFNIRIPLSLIRGGVKAGTLLSDKMGERLREKGIDLDQLSGGGLDDLIDGLSELDVDFQGSGESVRIYAE